MKTSLYFLLLIYFTLFTASAQTDTIKDIPEITFNEKVHHSPHLHYELHDTSGTPINPATDCNGLATLPRR